MTLPLNKTDGLKHIKKDIIGVEDNEDDDCEEGDDHTTHSHDNNQMKRNVKKVFNTNPLFSKMLGFRFGLSKDAPEKYK